MFAVVIVKDGIITLVATSDLPFESVPVRGDYDTAVYLEILEGYTNPNGFKDSLSVENDAVKSSNCKITTLSQEESALLLWRQTCKVSNFQAKAALLESDLLEPAEAIVNILGGKVKLSWDLEPTWSRTSKEIISIGEALGLSDTDIDNLFKLAEVQ